MTAQIYGSVFTAVLNTSSSFVSLASQSHGRSVYHFTKPSISQSSDDIAQLRRLGSSVNLTVHDGKAEGRKVVDVRVHLGRAILNIRYGTEARREVTRLTRHGLRTLGGQVWEREVGSGRWNGREVAQVRGQGSVSGWELEYVRAPDEYPELAWDSANIRPVRQRKQRRH